MLCDFFERDFLPNFVDGHQPGEDSGVSPFLLPASVQGRVADVAASAAMYEV